jgi:hypothetical protein
MNRHGVTALLALVPAACAPRIDDLRLEAIQPPHIGHLGQPSDIDFPELRRPIIVATLSTARDLRFLGTRRAVGVHVNVVVCHGRTQISRREGDTDIVVAGQLRHEPDSGVPSPPLEERPPPASGRFSYSVAINLRQTGGISRSETLGDRSYAELDLMRHPVDLCLVIDSVNFGPRWRTNTVVIPAEAIRAAIAAAAPR